MANYYYAYIHVADKQLKLKRCIEPNPWRDIEFLKQEVAAGNDNIWTYTPQPFLAEPELAYQAAASIFRQLGYTYNEVTHQWVSGYYKKFDFLLEEI